MLTTVNAIMATVVFVYHFRDDDVEHVVGMEELLVALNTVGIRFLSIDYCIATSQTNMKLDWLDIAKRNTALDAPDMWLGANYEWAEQYVY